MKKNYLKFPQEGGRSILIFSKINLWILIAIIFHACKKDDTTPIVQGKKPDVVVIEEPEEEVKSNFTILTNGADPLIAFANEADGSEFEFYGLKDNEGVPNLVNQVIVRQANDTMQYFLDEHGRPIKMIAANHTEFYLEWQDYSKAIITVVTKDGETQINTEVDFGMTNGRISGNLQHLTSKRLNRPISIQYIPFDDKIISAGQKRANYGNLIVSVSQCEAPATGSNVRVIAKSLSGKHLGYFPAQFLESGRHGVSIPNSTAPKLDLAKKCKEITNTLGHACIISKVPNLDIQICAALTAAVASSVVAAPAAPSIAAAVLLSC